MKSKIISLFVLYTLISCSCNDEFLGNDPDIFDDPIKMRVINNSDHVFSQVLIVPCFNTPDERFLDVNPSDTTDYKDYACGFAETIVEVDLQESGITLRHESLDFVTPLASGNYDCIIRINDEQILEVDIQLSQI